MDDVTPREQGDGIDGGWFAGVALDRTLVTCALCARTGSSDVTEHRLTHGVTVLLCHEHRSERFQTEDAGNTFVAALHVMWRSAGCLTKQRQQALAAHLRRVIGAPSDRERPGSYSWQAMRNEAERRWAAGHSPLLVIHELRQRHSGWSSTVPSLRTMRRWYTEGRWLNAPPRTAGPGPGERVLAWVADQNRLSRGLTGFTAFPGWPEHDRWGRPYRRR